MGGNSAGVNHGVQRLARTVLQGQLVEGLARGLNADLRQHVIKAAVGQGQRVHEGLGNRLDRELHVAVAGGVLLAVHHHDGCGQLIRVHGGQLGNVVRQLPGGIGDDRRQRLGEVRGDG